MIEQIGVGYDIQALPTSMARKLEYWALKIPCIAISRNAINAFAE